MTLIEFYEGRAEHPLASVRADAVPREGEFVNIRKLTYLVVRVTWAVDRPTGEKAQLRANVELEQR